MSDISQDQTKGPASSDGRASAQRAPHENWRVLRQALSKPRRFIAVWYLAYLLLGIVTAGMVPVLLPLMMVSVSHELGTVAYVMGAYNLGLLLSPLEGILAERRREYRGLFFAGLALVGLGVAAMTLVSGLTAWFAAAFVIGASSSAAATVATLFVVDFTPHPEWEPRIGWLQSFNGAGQVVGLLLAGVFSQGLFDTGLWVAAACMVPALFVGRMGLPAGPAPARHRDAEGLTTGDRTAGDRTAGKRAAHPIHHLDFRALAAFPRASLGVIGLLHHSHHLSRAGWSALPRTLRTVFGRFLISWFAASLGVAGFFAYFPLMMRDGYAISAGVTSLAYAAAAAVGIALFILASRWAGSRGPGLVYRAGLILRIAGFALLLVMYFLPFPGQGEAALAGFVLIVLAWPILSVAGTSLAADLTTGSEGSAMGMLNASAALATVLGTFASGPLVHLLGYGIVAVLALAGLIAALVLGRGLEEPAPKTAPPTPETAAPETAGGA